MTCECGNKVNPQSGIYCDECIERRSNAYAKWAVKEITDEELEMRLNVFLYNPK